RHKLFTSQWPGVMRQLTDLVANRNRSILLSTQILVDVAGRSSNKRWVSSINFINAAGLRPQDSAFVGLSNFPSFDRDYAGKERTKTSFGFFELILCSEHSIDRSAHLFQNKSRRQAIHHFELIRLTWTNFKSIGLHSFYGDFNHVFPLHDRSTFHVFKIKVTPEFGLCRRGC